METHNTKSEQLCTRILQGVGATLVACVLVLAVPAPTKHDFEGRSPWYSKRELLRTIHWYARQYRLDPALLRAVVKAESDFDTDAVSRKGAAGLMQLMPRTAASLRVADPFDPIQNIRAGAKQLRYLVNLYDGDLRLALAAYNAGVDRVKGNKVPRIWETRAYVQKVLRYYRDFKATEQHHKAKPPGAHYRPAPPKRPSPPAAAPPPKKGSDPRPDPYTDPPQASISF